MSRSRTKDKQHVQEQKEIMQNNRRTNNKNDNIEQEQTPNTKNTQPYQQTSRNKGHKTRAFIKNKEQNQ